MRATVDDEGRFTDVSLWQAVQNVPDPERFQSILCPSEGKKAVGFRLDLTLEWSFSCNVDWTLLPIPFLDNLCNFLSARDVMVLGATCREMRRRISTMVLAEEARKVTTCFYFWILSSVFLALLFRFGFPNWKDETRERETDWRGNDKLRSI